jgi:hypothetical protein
VVTERPPALPRTNFHAIHRTIHISSHLPGSKGCPLTFHGRDGAEPIRQGSVASIRHFSILLEIKALR